MGNVTVNISFQDSLLAEIDAEASRESRSRSELLREAARGYIRRQRQWDAAFALGDAVTERAGLSETDVAQAVTAMRKDKRKSA